MMKSELKKMTVFEIYLAICVETVDIWNNPQKYHLLCFVDQLDNYNHILEVHAMNDTLPSEQEWKDVIAGLLWLVSYCTDLKPIIERATELIKHPEYFDAALNASQREAYSMRWDKRCIDYYVKNKGKKN